MTTVAPHISKDTFVEILQDKKLVQPLLFDICNVEFHIAGSVNRK